MADALRHRGPDGEGTFESRDGRIQLGHRRLAILDTTPAGAQPMRLGDRYALVFNGEIYNYIELRQVLEDSGHEFRSRTDTEVLLVALATWGEQALERLDGMFAFAFFDEEEGRLFCARDRFGEKPFFYRETPGDGLIFASEMKAIFAAGVPAEPDPRMLYFYLAYGALNEAAAPDRTFFRDIRSLPPGHLLTVERNGRVRTRRYYDLVSPREPREIEADVAARRIYELLERSVTRRLRSDVPLGSSLSGGIDSTAIVSLIDRLADSDQPLRVFSARFNDPERDEGPWIGKALASVRAEPHETRPTAVDLADTLSHVFFHQEEPFASASILAQWKVMELAGKTGVTVLLDGQGADEIFAGYPPQYRSRLLELYRTDRDLFAVERQAYEARHGRTWPLSFGMRFFADALSPGAVRLCGRVRRSLTTPGYMKVLAPEFAEEHRDAPPPFVTFRTLDDALRHRMTQQGLPALLRYADRNAMAFAREVRLPYLCHELVEFAFSLPAGMKLREGWTKWILRRAVDGLIPREIAWREDKLGYEPPQDDWLADPQIVERTRAGRELLVGAGVLRDAEAGDAWPVLMASELFAFADKFAESAE